MKDLQFLAGALVIGAGIALEHGGFPYAGVISLFLAVPVFAWGAPKR